MSVDEILSKDSENPIFNMMAEVTAGRAVTQKKREEEAKLRRECTVSVSDLLADPLARQRKEAP